MEPTPLAIMVEEERRYDALPPWAWARPVRAADLAERRIAALERMMRENESAFADDLARLSRLMVRHRMNARAFAARLARLRNEGAAR